MYERPPTRFEHRTTTNTTRTGNRSPATLVRSWEAFDRLFEDAFAPVQRSRDSQAPSLTSSQYTADNRTQATYETARPQARRSRDSYDQTPIPASRSQLYAETPSQTGKTYLYEETPYQTGQTELYEDSPYQSARTRLYETPSQTGLTHLYEQTPAKTFSDMFDDGLTERTAETALPGSYPQSYPQGDETPRMSQGPLPRAVSEEVPESADEDFARLWAEAEANRRKRMTRTVTRRRILQHGVMSPGGTVSTMPTEPEHKLRRKKSRFHLYRNGNADYMTATFDLPDVSKEDVHVAFQSSQLTITWESTITTERRADDRTIIRERKERKYARTLPLPPNTDFSDIKAYLENGVLTVMYPKFSPENNRTLSITQ